MKQLRKKFNIWRLAVNNVSRLKLCYGIIFAVALISSFGVMAGLIIYESMSSGINTAKDRIGADIIVVSDRYKEDLTNSLFKGKPSTIAMEENLSDILIGLKSVNNVTGQLYMATLGEESCCDGSLQLIAFDEKSDFIVNSWVQVSAVKELKADEIIVGSGVNKDVGDKVKYFNRYFTIAKVLDNTGLGYDTTGFITRAAAADIMDDPAYEKYFRNYDPYNMNSALFIRVKEDYTIDQSVAEIKGAVRDKSVTVYATDGMVRDTVSDFKAFTYFGVGFLMIIIILTIIASYSVTVNTTLLRKREIGSMRLLGLGNSFIVKLIALENIITCSLGVLVGGFGGISIDVVFYYRIRTALGVAYRQIGLGRLCLYLLAVSAVYIILLFAAVLLALRQINKYTIPEMAGEN